MKLFEVVKAFFKDKEIKEVPEDFCPNCWGTQAYGGEFYEAIRAEDINLTNVDANKGWIDAYASKNLTGIKLIKRKGMEEVCPACNFSK